MVGKVGQSRAAHIIVARKERGERDRGRQRDGGTRERQRIISGHSFLHYSMERKKYQAKTQLSDFFTLTNYFLPSQRKLHNGKSSHSFQLEFSL
jgi:hypothetical protein